MDYLIIAVFIIFIVILTLASGYFPASFNQNDFNIFFGMVALIAVTGLIYVMGRR